MATAGPQDAPFISSTITTLNDEMLFEIFLRLPNHKSLIQNRIVCKRWFSMISLPQFLPSFNEFRHNRKHKYHLKTNFFFSYNQGPHFHKLISNHKSKNIIPAAITSHDLSFLPFPNAIIRASYEDLLFLSREGSLIDYYICNPFTKQWLALPESTHEIRYSFKYFGYPLGYSFICEKPNQDEVESVLDIAKYRYRAVLIFVYDFRSFIFCSETGKWLDSFIYVRNTYNTASNRRHKLSRRLKRLSAIHDAVASNRVLYYLGGLTRYKGIIAFNPFAFDPYRPSVLTYSAHSIKGRFIPVPVGFSSKWRRLDTKGDVRLGVVRGQLRLLQLLQIDQTSFGLKIWELINYDDGLTMSWLLVHDVKLNGVYKRFDLAFHPNNGDVIFVVRDSNVYLYQIEKEKYEKISEFSYNEYSSVTKILNVFTIMEEP